MAAHDQSVYIGIGSNISPEDCVERALVQLSLHTKLLAVSTFYWTPAIGRPEQADYLNGTVRVEVNDWRPDLFKHTVLTAIEDSLGRVRGIDPYAPRTIDLDIVLWGTLVTRSDGLMIPHPDLYERAFVATPLYELAPNLILPDTGRPIAEVVQELDAAAMRAANGITKRMQERIA